MVADADPAKLASLANAVGAAQHLATLTDGEIASIHDDINKSFTDAYPNAHPTPGSATPGQFQRPFLTTGRAPLSSTGANARIPVANSTMQADNFTRSPLENGRERTSPENTEGPIASTASAAEQIASASRDHSIASLTALHDHIASAYPDICPLGAGDGQGTRAGFSNAGIDTLHMGGNIKPIAAGATPSLTKSEKKLLKKAKKLAKAEKLIQKAAKSNTIEIETNDNGEVFMDTEKLQSIVKSLIEEHVQDRFAAFDEVLSVVQSEVEKLGSEPDPAKAPVRGTVVVERAIEKSASEAETLRRAAEDGLKEQIAYLSTLQKSGNPELRMRAEAQLASLQERITFEDK
jgi:hypothetical protein